MEIYMTRNATSRGLVPLWDQLLRCRWYTNILLKIYNFHNIFWRPVHKTAKPTTATTTKTNKTIDSIERNNPTNGSSSSSSTNMNNNVHNDLALYLFNRQSDDIQVLQLIESYCETECCFQYVRSTQTKAKHDRNIINTIEVFRGPRSINTNDMINETYI